MIIFFVVINITFSGLRIEGLLYQYFMFLIIVLNIVILIRFRNIIHYRSLAILIYFFLSVFSKDILQFIFAISSMITLDVIKFKNSNFIKMMTIFVICFFSPYFFLLTFIILNNEKERRDIYENTHYYCENHYEIYSYSAGAMDKFHYSIDKYYNIIDLDGILFITYNERSKTTREEYESYIENHNCNLVGDKHGFE